MTPQLRYDFASDNAAPAAPGAMAAIADANHAFAIAYKDRLPQHPNTLASSAVDETGDVQAQRACF
jgi:hypothetical protein